jgi:hypothetical protein
MIVVVPHAVCLPRRCLWRIPIRHSPGGGQSGGLGSPASAGREGIVLIGRGGLCGIRQVTALGCLTSSSVLVADPNPPLPRVGSRAGEWNPARARGREGLAVDGAGVPDVFVGACGGSQSATPPGGEQSGGVGSAARAGWEASCWSVVRWARSIARPRWWCYDAERVP